MNALVFAGDDSAGIGLAVAIHSAVKHTGPDTAVVVLDAGMSAQTRARLARVHPAVHWVELPPERLAGLSAHRRPLGAYAWLLFPDLLPGMQRAVYLDYDVLVKRDLAPLFAIDLHGAPVAGVRDFHRPHVDGRRHFNSGVVVLDCQSWRDGAVGKQVLQYAAEQGDQMFLQDQEALNMVIHRWAELDPSWNVQRSLTWFERWAPSDLTDQLRPQRHRLWRDAGVIHFSGFPKPWQSSSDMPCTWAWVKSLLISGYHTPAERARWIGAWFVKRVARRGAKGVKRPVQPLIRLNVRVALGVRRRWRDARAKIQRESEDRI